MNSSPDRTETDRPIETESYVAVGTSAVAEILARTEKELERIAAQTNMQAERVTSGVQAQAAALAGARLEAIAALRWELMERASALALRFEELLDLLEHAESQISEGLNGDAPRRSEPTDGAPVFRLRERQRITYSTDSPYSGHPQQPRRIVRPPPPAPLAEPRKIRWWQRWFRDAA